MELMKKNDFNGAEVVTVDLIALKHGQTKFNLNKLYRSNKKWFVEGKDVFTLNRDNNSLYSSEEYRNLFGSNKQREAYLFTKTGWMNFVKIMDSESAWEVWKEVVETYFTYIDKYKILEKQYVSLQAHVYRKDAALAFLPMREAIENNIGLSDSQKEWGAKNYSILICKLLTDYTPTTYRKHYKTHGLGWRDHIKHTFPELLKAVENLENYIAHLQESEITYKEARPLLEKYALKQLNKIRLNNSIIKY